MVELMDAMVLVYAGVTLSALILALIYALVTKDEE